MTTIGEDPDLSLANSHVSAISKELNPVQSRVKQWGLLNFNMVEPVISVFLFNIKSISNAQWSTKQKRFTGEHILACGITAAVISDSKRIREFFFV